MALKPWLCASFYLLAALPVPAGPHEGTSCIVLISRSNKEARIEKVATAIYALRDQARLARERMPVAVLTWADPSQRSMIENLGFVEADLPLATTGVVDASHKPVSANLNRPPLTADPRWISGYLVSEWSRRQENPPGLPQPDFAAAPQGKGRPGKVNSVDGSDLIYVPDGKFWRGSCEGEIDEFPPQLMECRAFYLAKSEVSVAQFRKFVTAQGYQTTAEKEGFGWCWSDGNWRKVEGASWRAPQGEGSQIVDNAAVVQVSLEDARAYCNWAGLRLPKESEWEKAARGTVARRYPWGEKWADRAQDVSVYGCLKMGSSVREWTDSEFQTYQADVVIREPRAGRFVVRGGSRADGARECRTSYRFLSLPTGRSDVLGFRTAWSEDQKFGNPSIP